MNVESTQSDNVMDTSGTGKPVVLHVLHSWGGGVDFFARDLQAGDRRRTHVFLKSHSRDNLPPFGKELSLYLNLDHDPVASWHLSSPIMDTQLHSAEVSGILRSIIEKWAVGAVIVSSLIGHSLDVLGTGLPTALAIHDVYPFWPLLHDANTDDYSVENLSRSLAIEGGMNIFADHPADYWTAIRNELIAIIGKENVLCISPSNFSKERVCRIDPRLHDARWAVIPHGLDSSIKSLVSQSKKASGTLRVLVPGHINSGKGEILLNELIPDLPDGIEVVLLGSAHLSERFASGKVETIAHYERKLLGSIVNEIQPDVAMLPSTVPETYGYVMSEMLQLGVPVICSNIGAYAERGNTLPGVTLVNPDSESFKEMLARFRDDSEFLAEQKKGLPHVFPDLKEMASSWTDVLPANPPQWLFEFSDDPSIANEVKMNLQLTHLAELLKLVQASTEQNAKSGGEALESINRQQSSIQSMLEIMNTQSQQFAAVLAKQGELEADLAIKNREIAWLSTHADAQANALREQAVTSMEREKSLLEAIEKLEAGMEKKLASIHDAAEASRDGVQAMLDELQTRTRLLHSELAEMKAKRGWRLLSFFR